MSNTCWASEDDETRDQEGEVSFSKDLDGDLENWEGEWCCNLEKKEI